MGNCDVFEIGVRFRIEFEVTSSRLFLEESIHRITDNNDESPIA